jgi:hypothetical protein
MRLSRRIERRGRGWEAMRTRLARSSVALVLLACVVVANLSLADTCSDSANALNWRGSVPTEKDRERHELILARKEQLIRTGGTELVFIGDFITDRWQADPQREIFEDYFGPYRPYNIGIAGDQTQHVLWRIQHGALGGIDPKVVVVLIGTNNIGKAAMSVEETAHGITTVVSAIRETLPDAEILLLGVFPRGNRPDDPLRAKIKQVNALIARLDDGRFVRFLDIGEKFLEADGSIPGTVMPDYLHLSPRGYLIWAEALKPVIESLAR